MIGFGILLHRLKSDRVTGQKIKNPEPIGIGKNVKKAGPIYFFKTRFSSVQSPGTDGRAPKRTRNARQTGQ